MPERVTAVSPHVCRCSQLVRLDTYIKEQQASAAAKAPAAASTSTTPYGVLLHTNQPYGPMPRHVLDIYVPEPIARAMGNQVRTRRVPLCTHRRFVAPSAPISRPRAPWVRASSPLCAPCCQSRLREP